MVNKLTEMIERVKAEIAEEKAKLKESALQESLSCFFMIWDEVSLKTLKEAQLCYFKVSL